MKQGTISFLIGGLYSLLITVVTAIIIYIVPFGMISDDIDRHGLKGSTEQSLQGIIMAGIIVLLSFITQITLIYKLARTNKNKSHGATAFWIIQILLILGILAS